MKFPFFRLKVRFRLKPEATCCSAP